MRICRWTWTQFSHTAWFHAGSLKPPHHHQLPLPPPQHHACLCEAVFLDFPHPPSGPLRPLFHLCPLPSCAAILHFWVGGLQETAYGDSQYRMLIRPSAALPTIFLLDMSFCFVVDSIIIATFLLSGGRSAALTAAEGLPVIWPLSHPFRIHLLLQSQCLHYEFSRLCQL